MAEPTIALVDLTGSVSVFDSSYRTWVRFDGAENANALPCHECRLHSDGEIAMGAAFNNFTVSALSFRLVDSQVVLGRAAV